MVDYLQVARQIYTDSQSNTDAGWAIAAALIAIAESLRAAQQPVEIHITKDRNGEQ